MGTPRHDVATNGSARGRDRPYAVCHCTEGDRLSAGFLLLRLLQPVSLIDRRMNLRSGCFDPGDDVDT